MKDTKQTKEERWQPTQQATLEDYINEIIIMSKSIKKMDKAIAGYTALKAITT